MLLNQARAFHGSRPQTSIYGSCKASRRQLGNGLRNMEKDCSCGLTYYLSYYVSKAFLKLYIACCEAAISLKASTRIPTIQIYKALCATHMHCPKNKDKEICPHCPKINQNLQIKKSLPWLKHRYMSGF